MAYDSDATGMSTFAMGLEADFPAVQAGLSTSWSSALPKDTILPPGSLEPQRPRIVGSWAERRRMASPRRAGRSSVREDPGGGHVHRVRHVPDVALSLSPGGPVATTPLPAAVLVNCPVSADCYSAFGGVGGAAEFLPGVEVVLDALAPGGDQA